MKSPNIRSVAAIVTHVNRTASVHFEALRVEGSKVLAAPNTEDIASRLQEAEGCAAIPLSAVIRAFRMQLGRSAPEHECRKWTLYCSFEGYVDGQTTGPARRSVPPFYISLPKSVTAATPLMTPAATADAMFNAASSSVEVDTDGNVRRTLGQLLELFFSADELKRFVWHAKVTFVLGEDEEEERKRKAELKAATVALSQPTTNQHPNIPLPPPEGLFHAAGGAFSFSPPGGGFGGNLFNQEGGFGQGGFGGSMNQASNLFGNTSGLFTNRISSATPKVPKVPAQAPLFQQSSGLFAPQPVAGNIFSQTALFGQPSSSGLFGQQAPSSGMFQFQAPEATPAGGFNSAAFNF